MNIHQKLQRNIAGGIASGIGSILGGMINAGTQRKINERNLEEQKAENERSRQFTEHMYNTYESPAAQMQQMQEAGLNPMGAVSPQSVGSASTSSLPPAQSPNWGDAIVNAMPSFFEGLLSAKEARNKDLEASAQELENWRTAFENGNAEELYELQKKQIEETIALTRQQKREKQRLIRDLDFTYQKAKEAYDNGANEFTDEHNESVARVAKLYNDITNADSQLKLDWSRYLTDKQLSFESIKQLSRENQLAEQVMSNYNIDYNALPDYLKTMLSGIILLEKKATTTMFDTVGDKRKFDDYVSKLKADFETYYLSFIKNSSDVIATQAGNHITNQNIISALGLLK